MFDIFFFAISQACIYEKEIRFTAQPGKKKQPTNCTARNQKHAE
jgi:hypothetical protein